MAATLALIQSPRVRYAMGSMMYFAQGIPQGLLAIAIPAIAAYNILKNRVARLVLEVGIVSEGLMGRFQNVGKK